MTPDGLSSEWGETEQAVWEMLGEGKTTSQIAAALGIGYWDGFAALDACVRRP